MSTWTVSKDLVKKRFPDEECFYSSVKDGTTGNKCYGHVRMKII